ncbi:ABC transporter substrate-binding protein [Prolixibacter sp. NT017]|uniref:ABC transporter substrate-binding protein n=1 Tax=Prolixibacter sp. NT017 TaxID=2652390 RepID=UPI0012738EAA|nr:ABC transporter substrate-binding protein [Prolixibacter sp. NT017]GET25369.1 ABC transporter substrate-binding protein [Prolixibacter sp. NT017]
MLRKLLFLALSISFLFYGCKSKKHPSPEGKSTFVSTSAKYARGFTIEDFNTYEKLTVLNPWQKSSGVSYSYYLVPRNRKIPASLQGKNVVRTPVRRVVCLSTTQLGFLEALNETSSLVGIPDINLVSDSSIIQRYHNKQLSEVGYAQGLNYELLLSLKPDLVLTYGVDGEVSAQLNKLKDLGVPVMLVGEYLESTPLAKCEWIKFIGAIYGKEAKANKWFNRIDKNYQQIKKKMADVDYRPKVLTGLPWKDNWWMAGGKSNLANLIHDAGGEYLWHENTSRNAFVVSIEDVFMKAKSADFWINSGTANSMKDLLSVDSRFSSLPPVKKHNVYNNNARVSAGGGNDYWEKGVVRPDLILRDLVRIFHPDKENDGKLYFYRQLN